MKISCNWLLNYLQKSYSTQELAQTLTFTGLEVEGIETYSNLAVDLDSLVVGQVKEVWQHPGADKLSLTRVLTDNGKERRIVCGAPNVADGQKVIVALPGTVFYENGREKMTVKESEIRGEPSEGMICSEKELGLGDDHSGIMVLDTDKEAGAPATEVLDAYRDTVFDIGLTPNRSDGASHIGCARDVAAVKKDQTLYPSVEHFKEGQKDPLFSIDIRSTKECYRYAGLSMDEVKVGASPEWLQNYLKAIDLRPVNNVVDASIYVMMETGQPLHIFDRDYLQGETIRIEKAGEKQKFQTLDEDEHELLGDELMIKDGKKPVAMAGIMGGLNSSVSENTQRVFLESACFDPIVIRRAASLHQLSTDASFRYERGVDPNLANYALKRLALVLQDISGAVPVDQVNDKYPEPEEPLSVFFSFDYLDNLAGQQIEKEEVKSILERLEFGIEEATNDGLRLRVPTFRRDVTRPVDIAEEVLRIYSFDAIAFPERVSTVVEEEPSVNLYRISENISNYLSASGFREIYTNSLMDGAKAESLYSSESIASIVNPLSQELNVLRPSVLLTGLDAVKHNLNHKNPDLKFFERGKSFFRDQTEYSEEDGWHLWLTGQIYPESWYQKSHEADHFYLKGVMENLLQRAGVDLQDFDVGTYEDKQLVQAQCLKNADGVMAEFGQVSPFLLKDWEIGQKVFYGKVYASTLENYLLNKPSKEYQPVNRFPYVRRDLSIMLHKDHVYSELEEVIRQASEGILTGIRVFDVYEGEKIDPAYKSYAVKLIYESSHKTLKEEEIDRNFHGAIEAIEAKLNANVRKS